MMMAVAQDLPALENRNEYKTAKNSEIFDLRGRKITTIMGRQNRILVDASQISPIMKNAVVASEDERYFQHRGFDLQAVGRALTQDVLRRQAVQGGSTLTQQFVKNALVAQQNRSIFQKLKETALAYHLERKWSKEKILTEYLNSVYFGQGAYGIELAARTYFGVHASELTVPQSALLAGLIPGPSAFNPATNAQAAKVRRDIVIKKMLEQHMISQADYDGAISTALPAAQSIHLPQSRSKSPYFTGYVTQQLVDRYGAGRTFGGGLRVYTTLDLDLQARAEGIVQAKLAGVGPSAAVVALDNETSGIRVMVGGLDPKERPFNLATQGRRQPGSSFKPFTSVTAVEQGISPSTIWNSHQLLIDTPRGKYAVKNYGDAYSGPISLADATRVSDNSVYVQVGQRVGTKAIARTARRMGIESPLSRNPAMILGGLRRGVTPLEMAHAYETIAEDGKLVGGTLAPGPKDPVAIRRVEDATGKLVDRNQTIARQVVPAPVASTVKTLLQGVVSGGTGTAAAYGGFAAGKTGTTEAYSDAWFVGIGDVLTASVWVGYEEGFKEMQTEYHGEPVAGGTYPTEIWHDLMVARQEVEALVRGGDATGPTDSYSAAGGGGSSTSTTDEAAPGVSPSETVESGATPSRDDKPAESDGSEFSPGDQEEPTPAAPAPEPTPGDRPPDGGGGSDGGSDESGGGLGVN